MNHLLKYYIFSIIILAGNLTMAQTIEAEKDLKSITFDTIKGWKKGGNIAINLSQTSLSNWASGGQNSIATNSAINLYANFKNKNKTWDNTLDIGYGLLRQGKTKNWWKTDDKIDISSKFGSKAIKRWFYAGLINFKTQMQPGFNYPNDSVLISDFLAPGYLLGAIGMDYKYKTKLTLFIAPFTSKITFVNNTKLADNGAFGVEKAGSISNGVLLTHGKHSRTELGGYIRIIFKDEIMKNISLQSKIELFSNYIKKPKNIDVNWETILSMKVNKYISANITTNLVYDDDTKIALDRNKDEINDSFGPRTQFKEVFGVGLSYKF